MNSFLNWQDLMDCSSVLAVLSAFVLWPIPCVRWLAALVALCFTLALVTTSWHYGAVTAAGGLLVLVCCRLSMALLALENPRLQAEVSSLRNR